LAGAGVPSAIEQDRTVSTARAPNSKGPISLGSDSTRAALGVYAFSGMASATPSERLFNICQCLARSPANILRASSAHNVWLKKKISAQGASFRNSLGISMVPMISRVEERRSTLERDLGESRKLLPGRAAFIDPARLTGLEPFMVEIRRRPLPRHGTDHDSKPLPSFSGIRLPARLFRFRLRKHRNRRASTQGFGGGLFPLPSAGTRLRSTRRKALRLHPFLGVSGLPALRDAARRLSPLRSCGRRGSSLGQRQASVDQCLHAVSGPLGAPPFVERNGRGVPHLLGQGLRRRRTCRHVRTG